MTTNCENAIRFLAQEKVWHDKATFDKAETTYYEKLAKVESKKSSKNDSMLTSHDTIENIPLINNNNSSKKSKSKKSKDNKSNNLQENSQFESQNINLKPNKKKESKQKEGEVLTENKILGVSESSPSSSNENYSNSKKSKAKEAKEKKNKANKDEKYSEEEYNKINDTGNLVQNFTKGSFDQGQNSSCSISSGGGSLANEVAKARQHIKQSLQCMDSIAAVATVSDSDFASKVSVLEKQNHDLKSTLQEITNMVKKLEIRVMDLEEKNRKLQVGEKPSSSSPQENPPVAQNNSKDDEDDGVDLFGSDSEEDDAEAAKIREQRLAAYAAKKSKKPTLIAKSNIILDVKPWDDETKMKEMEEAVRKITADGLLWGAAKLVPLAYGIHKLQISCVVEDDKISVDWLTEAIEELSDFVQSVDIAAFNKV